MPTTITGQNGVLLKQSTRISVTGCAKAKPTKKKKTKKGRKKAKNAIVARTTDSHAGQGRSKL
jgi:hypothetical protein